ncbi:MAG: hypothetical protein NT011_04805 [Kiritimatiellaeota bacterium]|nr:hypothetical protein [Kiritimatiellota bacterium]
MSNDTLIVPPLYHPPGMWAWDFWFAKQGSTYHAFYLQAPWCLGEPGRMYGNEHVGHATSQDLIHWTDQGPALIAFKDTWNDASIATGSVVAHGGKWWMLFSGVGNKVRGVGLAESDDLMRWRKVGDGPVVPFGKPFDGVWEGKPLQWVACADPYVYPDPVAGWFYAIINSQVVGVPISESGCLTTMRSRDMKTWEPAGALTCPGWFERLETPQVWQHGGRWYLYFGGAHDHGLSERYCKEMPEEVVKLQSRVNCVFTADRFEGPYRPTGKWWFTLPDGKRGYIAKVLPDPDGREMLFMAVDAKLSRPYPVNYAADGSLVLGKPAVATPLLT